MRGFTSVKRRHFIPTIHSLLGSSKTRPSDRSNRLLAETMPRRKLDAITKTDDAGNHKDENQNAKPKYHVRNMPAPVGLPATIGLVVY
jgi:hypothetical protein